jgi:NifB/MoaA-like Fe-S oxidoreductase
MEDIDIKAVIAALKQSNPQFRNMSDSELIKMFNKVSKDKLPEIENESYKGLIENYGTYLPKLKEFFNETVELLTQKVAQKKSLTTVRIVGYISETKQVIAYFNGDINKIDNADLIKTEAELKKAQEAEKAKKEEAAAKTKATKAANKQTGGKSKK